MNVADDSSRARIPLLLLFSRGAEKARPRDLRRRESKFWLEPAIELARNIGMSERQLQQARTIIEEHGDEFRVAWHRHFDG